MVELEWHTSSTASALHAAAAIAGGGRLVDARLARELARPVAQLVEALAGLDVPPAAFFRAAMPLSLRQPQLDRLVGEVILRHAPAATDAGASRLSRALADVESAMLAAVPDLPAQLALRIAPLRQAWDARGPGLWKALARAMPDFDMPAADPFADVLGVLPLLGGGGEVFPAQRVVSIEAVLANPHHELPEVVRLAWLLAQLFICDKATGRRPCASELVPVMLQAAEEVELARHDERTINLAHQAWRL